MISFVIGTLVTLVFLIKMLFSDLTGNESTVDAVKEGIRNAKDIHDVLAEDGDDLYSEAEDKTTGKTGRFKK